MAVETVGDLIDLLEAHDRSTPLRAAVQPSYPMAASVVGLAVKQPETSWELDDDDNEVEVTDDEGAGTVFLVISDNEDYGVSRDMWDEARYGW